MQKSIVLFKFLFQIVKRKSAGLEQSHLQLKGALLWGERQLLMLSALTHSLYFPKSLEFGPAEIPNSNAREQN